MFFMLIMILVFSYQIYLSEIIQAGRNVEDALAASELAAAVIDIKEFGRTGNVMFSEKEAVYASFLYHLRNNLQMDGEGRSKLSVLAAGPITVEDFRIYEVKGDVITEYQFDQSGRLIQKRDWTNEKVSTPNGTEIINTSLYGRCRFFVKGMNDTVIMGEKEKTVDIKMEEKE